MLLSLEVKGSADRWWPPGADRRGRPSPLALQANVRNHGRARNRGNGECPTIEIRLAAVIRMSENLPPVPILSVLALLVSATLAFAGVRFRSGDLSF